MRLDFNVLWVDDQPGRVDAQVRAIAKQMEDEGFNFRATKCKSMGEVRGSISSELFKDEVDLILVDWDLGGGIQGQAAIAEIRNSVQYKDVVFYSAQTIPDVLRKLAFEAGLEGVYCASREGLVDEVIGVFESLVKKVLDLDHARGIVMGATSDIDYMVTECLVIMHQQLDASGQNDMLEYAVKGINRQANDLQRKAARLGELGTMQAFLDDPSMFTAMDRLKLLSRALKTTFKPFGASRQTVIAYMQDVVPKRNVLGHQVLVPEGKPTSVTDSKGNTFSLAELRQLRRQILKHRYEFRELLMGLRNSK